MRLGKGAVPNAHEARFRFPFSYTGCSFGVVLLLCGGLSHRALASYDVVIDPGHGGSDPGAVGCGIREASAALTVAQSTYAHLTRAGLKVTMTRFDDRAVSLQGRVAYAREHGAKLFLSIHLNAHPSPTANGTETFHDRSGKTADRLFAERAQERQLYALGLRDRGVKTANFYVLTHSSMPAILAEVGFLSNCTGDALVLRDESNLRNAGTALAHSALQQLGLPIDQGPPASAHPVAPPQSAHPVAPPQSDVPARGLLKGIVYRNLGLGAEDTSERLAGATVSFAGAAQEVTSQVHDGSWETTLRAGQHSVSVVYQGQTFGPIACMVRAGLTNWCVVGLNVEDGTAADVPDIPPELGTDGLTDLRAMDLGSSEVEAQVLTQGSAGSPVTACALGTIDRSASAANMLIFLCLGVILQGRRRMLRGTSVQQGSRATPCVGAFPRLRRTKNAQCKRLRDIVAIAWVLLLVALVSLGSVGCESSIGGSKSLSTDGPSGSTSQISGAKEDALGSSTAIHILRQSPGEPRGVSLERVASVLNTLRKTPRIQRLDPYLRKARPIYTSPIATLETLQPGPPTLAPSGLEVLVTDAHLAGLELWTLESGGRVVLTNREGAGFRPIFSADGQVISFRLAGQSAYAVPFFHVDRTGQSVRPALPGALRIRQHEDRVELWVGDAWEPVIREARGHIVEVSVSMDAKWLAYRHFGEGYIIRDLDQATGYVLESVDSFRFSVCGDRFVFAQTEEDGQVYLSSTFYIMDGAEGPNSLRRIVLPEAVALPEGREYESPLPSICAENSPCEPKALPLFPSLDCSGDRLAFAQGDHIHVVALQGETN